MFLNSEIETLTSLEYFYVEKNYNVIGIHSKNPY